MTTLRMSEEFARSPPKSEKSMKNRVAEARACLHKAKLHLSNSRNLKTEIKSEVIQAVERLYQLVKDAEMEKGRGERPSEEQEKEEPENDQENRNKENDLILKMEEHSRLIRENNVNMERLKVTIERQQEALERVSYANVAAGGARKRLPAQTALHSLVVTSKDETESGEEILERIRRTVDAREQGIRVDKIRKAKDRKIIVGCKTQEERKKVKERLEKAEEHLSVEEIKNKDPLLILRDVLSYNSNEDILNALRNQNNRIYQNLDKQDDRIEIGYRKKTRNHHTCHIVIRVSPIIWKRMLEAEAVHIDMQRIRVADQSPLVQCSLCLGYGHGRRFCKESIEKCSHCGGPHMKIDCPDWLAGEVPSCCNCKRAKLDSTEHNAFSQECPVKRRWDALARATIAYC